MKNLVLKKVSGVIVIVLFLTFNVAAQQLLEVNAAKIDKSGMQVSVSGTNFGNEAPEILLGLGNGEMVTLKTAYVSSTEVIAFYEFFSLESGSYRLTVVSKANPEDFDSLTINVNPKVAVSNESETTKDQGTKTPDINSTNLVTPVDLTSDQTIGGQKTFTSKLTGTIISASQYEINGKGRILATPGFKNTFTGENSGAANASSYNSFFGADSGTGNTSGTRNSFYGFEAGTSNTTGSRNTFYGSQAGRSNTTGTFNAFVGAYSGFATTTASQLTFFGTYAGFSNTSGADNTFVGTTAGYSNTTGSKNVFIGQAAGLSNTTGQNNTFVGRFAGFRNTTGSSNSVLGAASGESLTTGEGNSFFGGAAGQFTNTGHSNTFFGNAAGLDNTSGFANTFLGRDAGRRNITGSANIAIGNSAGVNSTGSENVFIGVSAGTSNTTGSNNTIIGRFANTSSSNLTFATAIGAGAFVSASNTIQLGRETVDVVRIGRLSSTAGSQSVCLNTNFELAPCSGVPTLSSETTKQMKEVVNRVESQQKLIEKQQQENLELRRRLEVQSREIEILKSILCSSNKSAPVCK